MRGLQLGAAMGARVTSTPTDADWSWADRVVLVKRAGETFAARAHAGHAPIIWDAVDCWRQPMENRLTETDAILRLQHMLKVIRPDMTIGATQVMAADAGGVYLPHHGRIGLVPTPAREQVRVVGYDGNAIYLGRWEPALRTACAARGWSFVVNPPHLYDVDILVAFRDGQWDGWMPRQWKSGVKYVNAVLAGRTILTQDSAGFREIQPAGTVVERLDQIADAFDAWTPVSRRQAVVEQSIARCHTFTVDAIAARYLRLLDAMSLEAAC